jgi:L-iditol 2-dehydrogenase
MDGVDEDPGLEVRLHGIADLRIGAQPRPVPSAGEVLIRVTAVGLCGSDRHWFVDGGIGGTALDRPMVLGHEIAGIIASGPRAGQRVAIDPSQPCRRCPTCARGRPDLCPATAFAGYATTDGGLRTWMTWPGDLCHPVPDQLDDDEAAVLEALGVARHAVDLAAAGAGDRVAVVGSGPIGQLVVRVLGAAGIHDIVASDLRPHRVAAAAAAGASATWMADDLEAERAQGEVAVAIECAGEDAAVDSAMRLVRPGGRVILVGIPSGDHTTFRASVARRKGLSIVLSRRMTEADLPAAIRSAASGAIDVGAVISDRYALTEVDAAFRRLASVDGNKIIVRP